MAKRLTEEWLLRKPAGSWYLRRSRLLPDECPSLDSPHRKRHLLLEAAITVAQQDGYCARMLKLVTARSIFAIEVEIAHRN
jgi:hypothetical protein